MAEKMTRRTFMKSAAAAAAAISLSGVLVGCGGSGPAQNEVRVGAFIVAVYDAKGNVGGTVLGSGSNGSITATVKLTYSSSGKGFVEYPYEGMFTAKVKENQLKTLKPTSGRHPMLLARIRKKMLPSWSYNLITMSRVVHSWMAHR